MRIEAQKVLNKKKRKKKKEERKAQIKGKKRKKITSEEQWLASPQDCEQSGQGSILLDGDQSHRLWTQVPQACHPMYRKQSFP